MRTLLLTFAMLAVATGDASSCDPPTVTVDFACDTNAILTLEISATDPGDNLVEITGSILEFETQAKCETGQPYMATEIWRNFIHDVFAPRAEEHVSETLFCTTGLWYSAIGRAIDVYREDAIEKTQCCQCDRILAPIEATTWALSGRSSGDLAISV